MKEKDRILEGHTVNISFLYSSSLFNCIVLGLPYATGDCWKLKTEDDRIVYVQMFEKMERIEK